MVNMMKIEALPRFNRDLFGSSERFTGIGGGYVGGKAKGLAEIRESLSIAFGDNQHPSVAVDIPILTVIGTEVFDQFMQMNNLYEFVESNPSDERIAHAFQKTEFPYGIIGDLRGLIEKVTTPLAVRSSSLLEDAEEHPFAGVYGTKMIPNNQADVDSRFKKLLEAIKYVYASTFFVEARDYIKAAGQSPADEKMAVIVQEIVGVHHGERYYPHISGVGRSFNYYPFGPAQPEDRVIMFALGLGKTIVDGGKSWSVCPRYPMQPPPYGSTAEIMRQTQNEFWAVNMGKPPEYDPTIETEFMAKYNLADSEYDGTLNKIASTYSPERDKIILGCGNDGPRVLDFGPMLHLSEPPLLKPVIELMELCEKESGCPVEIEFAVTIEQGKAQLGLLQVRPMVVSDATVEISEDEMKATNALLASRKVVGNGLNEEISDIVYIIPDCFEAAKTPQIAQEVGDFNRSLIAAKAPYLLIGFGRWGSSDPWLGLPVVWSQISGAKVIVEATLPDMDVELSQGAHFFQNITSFKVGLLCVHHASPLKIDFDWLARQEIVNETAWVRHVRLKSPLQIKIDGRNGCGVILHD